MIDGPWEYHPLFYRKRRGWHVVTIPSVNPKLWVVGKTLDDALRRAAALFGVLIPAAQPPLTPLLPPTIPPQTPEAA